LTRQSPSLGLPRYSILESSRVSTLNQLLQCQNRPGTSEAELDLRDPSNGETIHVTVVKVYLEHDPDRGAMFFNGELSTGVRINGFVHATADEHGIVGSANIRF
jgi:hypothetical protein